MKLIILIFISTLTNLTYAGAGEGGSGGGPKISASERIVINLGSGEDSDADNPFSININDVVSVENDERELILRKDIPSHLINKHDSLILDRSFINIEIKNGNVINLER